MLEELKKKLKKSFKNKLNNRFKKLQKLKKLSREIKSKKFLKDFNNSPYINPIFIVPCQFLKF